MAVQLGRVVTVADPPTRSRRVEEAELRRLREQNGFPEELRESVRTVGTAEGAMLMDISPARFTRFARTGLIVPARFYLNRYRAVVWHYLADDLRQFARRNPTLLTGRAPAVMRARIAEGEDVRARNWRGRRVGYLLRQAEGPWHRAAVVAAALAPEQLSRLVGEAAEREHLRLLRPEPAHAAAPGSLGAQIITKIMTADDPEEIRWLSSDLRHLLDEARQETQAPPMTPPYVDQAPTDDAPPEAVRPSSATRSLLGRLRLRVHR